MARVFKSYNVTIDENNRVNIDIPSIKSKEDVQLVSCTEAIEEKINKAENNIIDSTEVIKDIIAKAELDANIILEQARLEAEKIKNEVEKQTLDNIEKIKEDGYNEGYKNGFDLGKQEAEELKKEAIEYNENLKNSLEADIVNLISELVKKILFYEVELNTKTICALVRSGLSKVSSNDEVKVRISTHDFTQVRESEDVILHDIKNISNVVFVEDSNLKKSDCIIETSFGSIDCSLLSQYNELHKNLYYILKNR